jgi:transcriptional regulator with XRE-family HTH domain
VVDNNLAREFGGEIRTLRTRKGVGLRQLAEEAGISKTYLSYIEQGVHGPPSAEKVIALAKALGENQDRLLRIAGHVDPTIASWLRAKQEALAPAVRKVDPKTLTESLPDVLFALLFAYTSSSVSTVQNSSIPSPFDAEGLYAALRNGVAGSGFQAQREFALKLREVGNLWLTDLQALETGQVLARGNAKRPQKGKQDLSNSLTGSHIKSEKNKG